MRRDPGLCPIIAAGMSVAGIIVAGIIVAGMAAPSLMSSGAAAQGAPQQAWPQQPAGQLPGVPQPTTAELVARMTPEQQQLYAQWKQERAAYSAVHDRYWGQIEALKVERRRKRKAGIAVTPADFVEQHPPRYSGPALRPDIEQILAQARPVGPQPPPLPTVADILAEAGQQYGFTPRLTSEREFKRAYAIDALRAGLTKEQVVRIYALETGGRGTYDMQAGIDPESHKGHAISTAIGYAQLLAANTIDELTRNGDAFVTRLNMLAATPGTTRERASELVAKAGALRAMLKVARSVPREWSEQVRLAQTPAGFAMHAVNLDADIGPWLQAVKLKGLKELGDRSGRPQLAGPEIELMNLAGPRTGLDMLEPAAQNASTGNFFSASGYYRNSIVRDKTAAELLVALDHRMSENMIHTGAIEFAAVFDEVLGVAPAGPAPALAPAPASFWPTAFPLAPFAPSPRPQEPVVAPPVTTALPSALPTVVARGSEASPQSHGLTGMTPVGRDPSKWSPVTD